VIDTRNTLEAQRNLMRSMTLGTTEEIRAHIKPFMRDLAKELREKPLRNIPMTNEQRAADVEVLVKLAGVLEALDKF
jgi:hypothetical protein